MPFALGELLFWQGGGTQHFNVVVFSELHCRELFAPHNHHPILLNKFIRIWIPFIKRQQKEKHYILSKTAGLDVDSGDEGAHLY